MNKAVIAMSVAYLFASAPSFAQTYDLVDWYEIDATGERAQALFPENVPTLDIDMGRPHHVYLANIEYPTGPLSFAMWVGPGVCGMNNCGLKIFDGDGRHLGGAEV